MKTKTRRAQGGQAANPASAKENSSKSNASRSTENSGKNSGERGRVENLKPWKPGQSGNPGGRPKRDIAAQIAAHVFEQNEESIAKLMMKALRKGNAGFAKVFAAAASRAYGQPAQVVDVNAAVEGNGTLRVEFINVAGLSEA